jgi:hypothetical protein
MRCLFVTPGTVVRTPKWVSQKSLQRNSIESDINRKKSTLLRRKRGFAANSRGLRSRLPRWIPTQAEQMPGSEHF